ncbi:MAG TPA: hypothetical protein IAA67_03155 [Candidatus Avoscillospira stercorigallinarum]|uniref:Uncharacterized protein n=1 Tax=Candidatus Avoscillospira stercorigallinarum TaxID=2840708 RepID=A0A9D0Z544_9FIRM|nr:hypothetical protein [Candidatus Avoscillospira stercorigallinarum]
MTLNFSSWILCPSGPTSIGYQYDNLTDVLQVTGTVPAGWSWDLMVQCGTNLNIIPMEQDEDGSLSVTLTAEMIPLTGYYTMQLRATQGELVKYTNQFQAYVGASLSGDAQWPTVPTEFTQVEQNILDLNQHPPYPGDEGYWMTWDLESGAYVQSQLPLPPVAEGPPGKAATIQVGATTTGEPGTHAAVRNVGNENAAILNFTVPAGPAGPTGATPQISVNVSTLPPGQQATVQVSGPAEAPTIAFGIPQGEPGERGPQGLQGIQGWGLSAAALDSDGALVLTLRNPADGQTQTLPPVPIDNSVALQSVEAAITAQGTTQVQRVEEAGDDAVGAVSTAKDAALEAVGQAQTTATGAVSSAKTTAVQAVQDAQGTATTAISQAQTDAVSAVEGAKTDALESVGALVQQAEDAAIRQPIISDNDTWMIWDAVSGQYVDTGLYAGGQAPYIGEDGYWYVGNVKTDTLARGPAGPAGAGVPSTEGVPTDYLLSPAGWVAPPSGGGSNELITLADFTVEGDAVASIVIDKDPEGRPFCVRKIYFLILPALLEGGATGTFPIWLYAGGLSAYRRVISSISNPNTMQRGISGFAIGLSGFAVGVMNAAFLNPASMELDGVDGIPYFEVRSQKTDSFMFRPGTVVKVYGQEVVE